MSHALLEVIVQDFFTELSVASRLFQAGGIFQQSQFSQIFFHVASSHKSDYEDEQMAAVYLEIISRMLRNKD